MQKDKGEKRFFEKYATRAVRLLSGTVCNNYEGEIEM
jgi:hypothetical protein